MALDPVKNFVFLEVSGSFLVGASTITLVSGGAAKLPVPATDGAFNLTLWNETDFPNPADAGASDVEIVRVTSITGEVLTITRAQESTTAIASTSGKVYRMLLSPTKKTIDDIDDNPLTTKGDIPAFSTAKVRLPVGTNGQVLTVDSGEATGLKYTTLEDDLFEDGSDGDVTISTNTTLTKDMFYDDLTINSSITLNTGGFRIFVKGTLIINGTIARVGTSVSGRIGGVTLSGETVGGGAAGGDGGGASAGSGTDSDPSLGGGSGGAGGGGAGLEGEVTVGKFSLIRNNLSLFTATLFSLFEFKSATLMTGGAGGGGGARTSVCNTGGAGGGGGTGGGIVFVCASVITNNGSIDVSGGGGGDGYADPCSGTNAGGGGGGGGGGVIVLVYKTYTGSGTKIVSGGTGGSEANGHGDGVDGSSGTVKEFQI